MQTNAQPSAERVFIALGSNLGDRVRHIEDALTELDAQRGVCVVARSRLHETQPVGGPPGQPMYLNAAAELRTGLEPQELLACMQRIEAAHGRERIVRDGPRTLDLDLLLYGFRRIATPALTVPHPRMWQRPFVLDPLREVCEAAYLEELRRRLGPAGRRCGVGAAAAMSAGASEDRAVSDRQRAEGPARP